MTEQAIQRSIVTWLRYVLPYGWIVQHTANRPRSAVAGGIERSMGVVKGWPDLALYGRVGNDPCLTFTDPFCAFIEIKTAKGRLSPDQVAVRDKLHLAGFDCGVARSIDDARALLRLWGVETLEAKR